MRRAPLPIAVCLLAAAAFFAISRGISAQEPNASAGTQAVRPAYAALGITPAATQDEIDEAFEGYMQHHPRAEPEVTTRAVSAYLTLQNPKWRRAYDDGKADGVDLDGALEHPEKFNSMVEKLDPSLPDRIKEIGKSAVEKGGEVIEEGIAFMAVSAFIACANGVRRAVASGENDDSACRGAIEGLTKVEGIRGFGEFVGGSSSVKGALSVSRAVLRRVRTGAWTAAQKVAPTAAAQVLGGALEMIGGSFASEQFEKFWADSYTQDITAAEQIKDPAKRKAAEDRARKLRREDTIGNSEFWWSALPGVVAGFGAFGVQTGRSMLFQSKVLQQGTLINWVRAMKSKLFKKACVTAELQEAAKPDSRTRTQRIADVMASIGKKSVFMLPGLAEFFAYQDIIASSLTRPAWNAIHTVPRVNNYRDRLKGVSAATSIDDLRLLLRQDSQAWDDYRKSVMTDVDKEAAPHLAKIGEFDKVISVPEQIYEWIANGAPATGEEWSRLQAAQFPDKKTPQEAMSFLAPYLRGFFCGPAPEQAFHPTTSTLGVPDIAHLHTSFDAYRVLPEKPPECDPPAAPGRKLASDSDFLQLAQSNAGKWLDNFNDAAAKMKKISFPWRENEVNFFEGKVDKVVVRALAGDGSSNAPTSGVVPSLVAQADDLKALLAKFDPQRDKEQVRLVKQEITQVAMQAHAAAELLDYMKRPVRDDADPKHERKAPDALLNEILGSITTEDSASPDSRWKRAVQDYEGMMKRETTYCEEHGACRDQK